MQNFWNKNSESQYISLKCLRKVIENDCRYGNYESWHEELKTEDGLKVTVKKISYFNNVIAIINNEKCYCELHYCGYRGYRSTERAINDLKRYYSSNGYYINVEDW